MFLREIYIFSLAFQLTANRNVDDMPEHLYFVVISNPKYRVQVSGSKDVACYAVYPINSMHDHEILKEAARFLSSTGAPLVSL